MSNTAVKTIFSNFIVKKNMWEQSSIPKIHIQLIKTKTYYIKRFDFNNFSLKIIAPQQVTI